MIMTRFIITLLKAYSVYKYAKIAWRTDTDYWLLDWCIKYHCLVLGKIELRQIYNRIKEMVVYIAKNNISYTKE